MPQSLSNNLTHIIFSTKDRTPWITPEYKEGLYAYLAETARAHKCECYRAGGVSGHMHLAIRLARTISLAKLIEELKSNSSRWMKRQSAGLANFSWQRGYASFSLSPKNLDSLITYIDKQEEHHRHKTFQEEYREFLQRYGIEWDEKYVWD